MFFSLPKAVLVSLVSLVFLFLFVVQTGIATAETISPTTPSSTAPTTAAPTTKAGLDSEFADYISNFGTSNDGSTVSGLTGGTIQNSTANNSATGLVFTINLGVNTASADSQGNADTISAHWSRLAQDPGDNNSFIIEVCNNSNATQCWLNNVPYTNSEPSTTGQHTIAAQNSTQDNFNDAQSVSVSAFNSTASSTTSATNNIYQYTPSTNTVNQIQNLVFTPGVSLTASLWYCAAGAASNATASYAAAGVTTNNPRTFGNLCGGFSYFQIGGTLPINIPTTVAGAQQQTTASQAALATAPTATSSSDDNLPACGVVWSAKGTINGCAAQLAYGIYYLCAWIAGLFGELFDFFIGYSVSSASYSYPFVVTGWTLVRDISNIFFIIIMVWTGFSAVFDFGGGSSMRKVVPALIVNAFLINFSLFFTRVVIDVSNVTARMFYSEMIVCKQADLVNGACPPAKAQTGLGGYWPLSEKIVSSFNPQAMFKPSVLNPPTTNTDGVQNLSAQAANAVATDNARTAANYFGVISIIGAAIMIVIAIMFFKVSFLFLGRVVGLYICMIFAPFAFLSRDIPMLGSVPRLKWQDWKQELTNYALLAPIFTFFLYIIYTFLSSNFIQQIGVPAPASAGFFQIIMSILIPMLIVYFLIDAAQKTAVRLSGDIGKVIQSYGEKATGAALGIATGGASLAATSAAGGLKVSDETRSRLESKRAAGGFSGQMASLQLKASDWTQKQTFDARNTKGVQALNKQFGMNPNNALVSALGFNSDRTKGGREGQIKRAQDATTKEINSIKTTMTDTQAEAFWKKQLETKKMQKKIERQAEAAYLAKPENAGKTVDKNSEEFKKEKEDAVKSYGDVKTNKQLTQALRVKYADTISNSSNLKAKDVLSAPSLLGAFTDNIGKKKAAKAVLDDQKKAIKSKADRDAVKPREAKLIETTEASKKELESINKTLENIYKQNAQKTIPTKPENAGKTKEEIDRLVEQEVVRLQSKDNITEANKIVSEHRTELKNNFDLVELDVTSLNDQHKEALKNNNNDSNNPSVKEIRRKLSEKIAERNKAKTTYDELGNTDKQKRDLENTINRNEGELERIAAQRKADEIKAETPKEESGEKKDDKK